MGRMLSVYATKGGVGKSFLAVNLAVNLHLETRENVLLVDFGQPFSIDVATYLELKKVNTLDKMLPTAMKLNPAILKSFVTRHDSGVDVLSLSQSLAPLGPEVLSAGNLEAVLGKLMPSYGWLVADVGMAYGPAVDTLLEVSDLVMLVCEPSILGLKHTFQDLAFLQAQNFPQEKIKLVLNRDGLNESISAELVQQRTNKEVFGSLPNDPQAEQKLADGKLYARDFHRHEVTKALDALTAQVVRSAGAMQNRLSVPSVGSEEQTAEPDIDVLKMGIHQRLLETFDMKYADFEVENDPEKYRELEEDVTRRIVELLDAESRIASRQRRAEIVKEIKQDVLGLGPLEDMLDDADVSEIMINRWDQIYVEQKGRLSVSPKKFHNEQHLMRVIERIVAPLGRKIDTSTPMVDARLKDGSRVNAIIPPLAINGAAMTIRKFPKHRLGVDDLIKYNTLNRQIAEFIQAAVKARLNVLVSGGTGSGKTTLLNILSAFIPSDERIITVEDSAELKLQQPHVVTLESRPPNIEGTGEVSIRDLVKNTLRMRPDRIVVGECRGAEALDMLQAMNTGHDGSLTTVHANTSREAIARLETLVMFAGFDLSPKAIKEQIVGAVDLIIQIKRFKDGSRHIVQVSEITGMEGDVVTMGDVFEFKVSGTDAQGIVQGTFVSTGYVPHCLKAFEEKGISIPREIFWTAD